MVEIPIAILVLIFVLGHIAGMLYHTVFGKKKERIGTIEIITDHEDGETYLFLDMDISLDDMVRMDGSEQIVKIQRHK
jgi:hypothetical protein